jgi:hypothetical protein
MPQVILTRDTSNQVATSASTRHEAALKLATSLCEALPANVGMPQIASGQGAAAVRTDEHTSSRIPQQLEIDNLSVRYAASRGRCSTRVSEHISCRHNLNTQDAFGADLFAVIMKSISPAGIRPPFRKPTEPVDEHYRSAHDWRVRISIDDASLNPKFKLGEIGRSSGTS